MNTRLLFKLQSFILGALSGAFALCLLLAALMDWNSGHERALTAFAISFIVALTLSIICALLGRGAAKTLFRREAMATIGIGWIITSLIGALPYWLMLPQLSVIEAIFESTSGVTTTGASILSNLESLPQSLHFWRALSQWMGGLGVVVFFVAVLSFVGAGAKVLFSRESSAQAADLDTSRVQKGVLQLMQLYIGLSLLCTFAFWLCGLSLFEATLHMFTTLSTGGFSTRSASVAAFANPALEWTMIAFMALGGTSFILMIRALKRDWTPLWRSIEFRVYAGLLVLTSITIALFLQFAPGAAPPPGFLQTLRVAAFQVTSIMTTTGYATVDFDLWLPVAQVLLLALMFIGGCSGSTAGGMKVIRLVIALRITAQQIEKSYRSRVLRPLKVNGKSLSRDDQEQVLVYILMLFLLVAVATILIALFEPTMSFRGIVSAMAACLFNIGPGFAEVGPTSNFAALHPYSLALLSLLMILGRLELFAVLVLFSPALWRRF
jgi:trk system potassium uptake protein TrkH